MATITLTDSTRSTTIQYTGTGLIATTGDIVALLSNLDVLYTAIPLDFLRVDKAGLPANEFRYRIRTKDGRVWRQNLKVPSLGPIGTYSVTFTVPEYWALPEFVPHREIRDTVVRMIRNYDMYDFDTTWA